MGAKAILKMLLVEPKVGKREKARAKLDSELQSLFDIFEPSNLTQDIIENVWLASAKDFELSLSRLFDLTTEEEEGKGGKGKEERQVHSSPIVVKRKKVIVQTVLKLLKTERFIRPLQI